MSDAMGPTAAEAGRAVDRACDRFEAAWRSGSRPRIEEFLAEVPDQARPRLLRELIALDADYRRLAGESPRPDDYGGLVAGPEPTWLAEAVAPRPPAVGTGSRSRWTVTVL